MSATLQIVEKKNEECKLIEKKDKKDKKNEKEKKHLDLTIRMKQTENYESSIYKIRDYFTYFSYFVDRTSQAKKNIFFLI